MSLHTARRTRAAVFATILTTTTSAVAFDGRVEIDTTRDLGPVRRDIYGTNFEYIGANVPEIESLVAGTSIARFPGGDEFSVYQWTDTSTGSCALPRWTWPDVATLAARIGMGFMLETNIVRGTPANAAAWLRDARGRGLRVPYVAIGCEVWGEWDAGFRTASRYADDVRAHAVALRAVDPTVKVVLEIGTLGHDTWNREAIRRAADVIDAVDYHYYPNHQSQPVPLEVAAGADGIAPLLARVRGMIRDEAGVHADHIGIIFGEFDGVSDPPLPGPPVAGHAYAQWSVANALFYGSALGELLSSEVSSAMFYELQGYRFGAAPGNACAPADLHIRRPKEMVVQLYREHFGDRLVPVSIDAMPTFHVTGPTNWDGFAGDAPRIRTYASLTNDGRSLRLIVVNRSDTEDGAVTYQLLGFDPEATAPTWAVAGDSIMATNENVGGPVDAVRIRTRDVAIAGREFVFAAAAHSVTAIELRRRTALAPDAPMLSNDATVDVVNIADVVDVADARLDTARASADTASDRSSSDAPVAPSTPGAGCSCRAAISGAHEAGTTATASLLMALGLALSRRAHRRRDSR